MLRGRPLCYPSPHSQVELALSKKFRDSIKYQAGGLATGTPAGRAKPLRQITQDEPRVYLASSLRLHPAVVVGALPSGHKPAGAHRPAPGPSPGPVLLHTTSSCLCTWRAGLPTSASAQKRAEVGTACLALAPHNAFSFFSSPTPSACPLQTCVVRPSSAALLFRHRVPEPSRPAALPLPVRQRRQHQLPGRQQPPERGRRRPQLGAAWSSGERHPAQGLRAQAGH